MSSKLPNCQPNHQSLHLDSFINADKIQETILLDKPGTFYDDFYRRITSKDWHIDSAQWIREKEQNWLLSRTNPELQSSQTDSPIPPLQSDLETRFLSSIQTKDVAIVSDLLNQFQQQSRSPSITTMNYAMNMLIEMNKVDSFHQLFLELKERFNLQPNIPTMTLLIKSYCRNGMAHIAEHLFDELKAAGASLHQVVYLWMMEGLLALKKHSKLMELYWAAKQIAPVNNNLAAVAIKSCGLQGEVEKAFLVYKELIATQTRPNNALLSELLAACVRRKDYYAEALGIVKQMESYGYSLKPKIYEYLLLGCAKNKDLQSACVIWDCLSASHVITGNAVTNMLWLLASIENEQNKTSKSPEFLYKVSCDEIVDKAKGIFEHYVVERGCKPSSQMLSALLAVMCRNKRVDDSKMIFYEQYKKYALKRHENSYESMFQLYQNVRDLKAALELRQEAKADGIAFTLQSYSALVNLAGLKNEIEVGIGLFREMIRAEMKPYLAQVRYLYEAANREEKMDIMQEMKISCKQIHVKGSAQKLFATRGKLIDSLLDDVYGPERGKDKERSKLGMQKSELKKLKNVGAYMSVLEKD